VRSHRISLARGCLALAILAGGCQDDLAIGRVCHLGGPAADASPRDDTVVIASPSLDCPARMCMHTPLRQQLPEGSRHRDLCTAPCDDDSDCEGTAGTPCVGGFTCAVAEVVGPFACEKVCVCRDYVVVPEGGIPLPAACEPPLPDYRTAAASARSRPLRGR
jgi:hypothetical protein